MATLPTTHASWLATLAAVLIMVFPAHAEAAEPDEPEAGRAMAPIVYATGSREARTVRLDNSVAVRPAAPRMTPSFSDNEPPLAAASGQLAAATASPNAMSAFASAGAIDLRPGAKPVKASFGPALPSVGRNDEAPAALLSRPAAAMDYAEPVAGPPYQVEGRWYVPMHEPAYDEVGLASWYGPTFHGKASATGETFDEMAMTAAHPTLPIPSLVRVTNMENGKSVVVRLNDRGPFVDDRIIDLSKGAAEALSMRGKGTAKVRVQYEGPAPRAANTVPAGPQAIKARHEPAQDGAFGAQPLAPLAPPVIASPPSGVRAPMETRPAQSAAPSPRQAGFYLQAGSFADLGNAHKLRDQLRQHGATVTSAQVDGSVFYRVVVGPWSSREDAVRKQADLAAAGARTIIVASGG